MLFLSIDWDFFPAFNDTGRTDLPDGTSAPNALLYDWGLGETGDVGRLESYLWHSRAGHFRSLGLDITKEFAIRPDRGSTSVSAFLTEMKRVAGGKINCPVTWADSHQWGYAALRRAVTECDEEAVVLHFDAHHDLGYKEGQVERMRGGEGYVDCGCWLLAGVEAGLVEQVHVVYPNWRGLDEWEDSEGLDWMPPAPHAQAWTWESYLERFKEEQGTVGGVFVARSGGWTPPWLDKQFQAFVATLGVDAGLLMRIGPEVEQPRRFDEEDVEQQAELRRNLLGRMKVTADGKVSPNLPIPGPTKLGVIDESGG